MRLAAAAMLVAAPRVVLAHPLHSTITEIAEDRAHGTVRATIRVFVDDFATAVERATARRPADLAGGCGGATAFQRAAPPRC